VKVTQHEHGLVLGRNAPGFVRSPGLHMSDLYGSLYKHLDPKRYDKRDADGVPEEMDWVKVEAGMGWEMRLEPMLEEQGPGERPGEFFTQHARTCSLYKHLVTDGSVICSCGAGVAYSPDWLFYLPDEIVLGEFKFTWYSLRDFPNHEKFDKWLCQVKCYCKHLKLLKCRIYPYWTVGGYPKGAPPTPVFDSYYLLEFTQAELDKEWNQLVRWGKKVKMIP
jgi:hypothetical protein